jgi:hypothetical protein
MKRTLRLLALVLLGLGGCGDEGAECPAAGQGLNESCVDCPCGDGLTCDQRERVCVRPS